MVHAYSLPNYRLWWFTFAYRIIVLLKLNNLYGEIFLRILLAVELWDPVYRPQSTLELAPELGSISSG